MEYLRSPLEDRNINSIELIKSPSKLKEDIPNENKDLVAKTRQEIRDILHGCDTKRLVMIIGPCSIDNPETALEYAAKLSQLRIRLEDELVIAMRTYPEKPRTTIGWTGLAYIPHLHGMSFDAGSGLLVTRQLLADINNLGSPCTVEFLDPITPQYYADLVSWAAIGARTTESQPHRQLASGLSMPIGFKNSMEGNIKVAVDAIITAASGHTFYSIDTDGRVAEVKTTGNPDTHIVLRGSNKGTNYDAASVNEAVNLIKRAGLLTESNRPIMIDCSHGNSTKDYRRQSEVAENVLDQIKTGQQRIMGLLIESNLVEGQQSFVPGKTPTRGVSFTDGCIGWKETEILLLKSARAIRPKRYTTA
ncbi:3-deoxy-7-phosphoheptulonate synthase [Candidatus Daviesbacteria bacterium]|nr:3-deoxy-7-phosphoheptulonate synthase [Candidatus Daviesbacteria bacterium]